MPTDEAKKALSGLMINNASEVQIRQTLILIYTMVGLRVQHYPNMAEDTLLISFTRSEFGLKTLDELLLAFKLAIKGELEIEDAKVYDQFTCEYMARIMTAYRRWLKSRSAEVVAPKKMIMNNVITSQEEKLADIAEWEAKEDVKIEFIPPYLFDYLVEFEKITPTKKEKWDAMALAADLRKTELFKEIDNPKPRKEDVAYYNAFLIMYGKSEYTGYEPDRLKNLAKKIMVFDYLKNINWSKLTGSQYFDNRFGR